MRCRHTAAHGVRCDPSLAYEPDLQLDQAFEDLRRGIGLSVDWDLEYSTIGDRARAAAQYSFLDLQGNGHGYTREAPTIDELASVPGPEHGGNNGASSFSQALRCIGEIRKAETSSQVSLRGEIEHVPIEGPQNAIAALDAVREDYMRAGRIRTLDLRSVPTASEEGVRIVQPVFVDE